MGMGHRQELEYRPELVLPVEGGEALTCTNPPPGHRQPLRLKRRVLGERKCKLTQMLLK